MMNIIRKIMKIVTIGLAFLISTDVSLGVSAAPITTDPNSPDLITIQAQDGLISFYFQNIEIRSLLQLIAKNAGLNFIIGDAIKGNITLSLKDVTWKQALDVILQSRGLTSRKVGNAVFISTVDEISTNETKALQSQLQMASMGPLESIILKLKYSNATDMASLIKGAQSTLLSARGQIAVDTRTNSIIVRDVQENLTEVKRMVQEIDVPAKQVLIEARIVNVDSSYEEELGVRFGISNTRNLSGNIDAANQLAQGIDVNQTGINPVGTDPLLPVNRLNFNLPASNLQLDAANPATIALALARLGPVLLDLELSALEGEQHAQVIAKPRVISSNQQTALIQTGVEIPYQQATSSGATAISFQNAVLSLQITPQITPDNKVILKLKASEDTQGANINVGGGSTVPAINTQSVESNILLKNNETVVLGGIYQRNKQDKVDRIPYFGSLPLIGALFRHTTEIDTKKELLIFITPKIIQAKVEYTSPIKTPLKGELG